MQIKEKEHLAESISPKLIQDHHGKIGVPILLYFLGVPGIVVIALWALFFRG